MVPLAQFLDMEEEEREGHFPYVWMVDKEQQLTRLLVAQPIVESCEDRRDFWTMLRSLAGADRPSTESVVEQARRDVVGKILSGLMQMAGESGEGLAAFSADAAPAAAPSVAPSAGAGGGYLAPWIDTADCTSCDECIQINPKIFEYNPQKKAVIKSAEAGPYKDLVKAAERCTARVIHPGLPRNRSEKDIEKWIKRGEKYN
jgi:pyruvate-ferredoxin/flavodoxin oxidoreductase